MRTFLMVMVMLLAATFALGQDKSIDKGWKNVELFESTRADVDKLLGKSTPWGDVTMYGDKIESVWVFYSKGVCTASESAKYKIEKDTVTGYRVYFFGSFPLSEAKWNQADYSKQPFGSSGSFSWYANKGQSIRFVTGLADNKEWLVMVDYGPTAEQKKKYSCDS